MSCNQQAPRKQLLRSLLILFFVYKRQFSADPSSVSFQTPFKYNIMDLKGQYLCERIFLSLMWVFTLAAAILTFVLDNVFVMFVTFVSGLAASALVSPDSTILHFLQLNCHFVYYYTHSNSIPISSQ